VRGYRTLQADVTGVARSLEELHAHLVDVTAPNVAAPNVAAPNVSAKKNETPG
jgi:hypothetical protein